MCSPKVTPGPAAAFGGITESLRNFGIPVACCADGPSGIRMELWNKSTFTAKWDSIRMYNLMLI